MLDGKVVTMPPMGPRRIACIDRLTQRFMLTFGERCIVRTRGPVQVGEYSQLQPDIAVIRERPDFYADHHPTAADVLFLVEVADTSYRAELDAKTPVYVAGGVGEVWVVDLVGGLVDVTTPAGTQVLGEGDSLVPAAMPDVVFDVGGDLGLEG